MTISENRAVRLFWLMQALEEGAVISARQISEALGVGIRAAQRDIVALSDLLYLEAFEASNSRVLWRMRRNQ